MVCAGLHSIAPNANAASDRDAWTPVDTGLQLTYTALAVADWNQTLHIARNPERFYEKNDTLGRHPDKGRVNAYFATTIAVNAVIAALLPKPYRTFWQAVWIGYAGDTVRKNHQLGLRLSF